MSFNKNTLALTYTAVLVLGFFISGLCDVLDYFIVKALLFTGFAALITALVLIAIKELDSK